MTATVHRVLPGEDWVAFGPDGAPLLGELGGRPVTFPGGRLENPIAGAACVSADTTGAERIRAMVAGDLEVSCEGVSDARLNYRACTEEELRRGERFANLRVALP